MFPIFIFSPSAHPYKDIIGTPFFFVFSLFHREIIFLHSSCEGSSPVIAKTLPPGVDIERKIALVILATLKVTSMTGKIHKPFWRVTDIF